MSDIINLFQFFFDQDNQIIRFVYNRETVYKTIQKRKSCKLIAIQIKSSTKLQYSLNKLYSEYAISNRDLLIYKYAVLYVENCVI